ncbi:protein of unknown function DUF6 transmembrane [Thermaerobacter marianensis DSM 12885]|uniref:EamA domain-containing protein n=1 Tax=Thermaerobacter marianensis (strain ATCC 700841 / DSM 12885 / JCM 10246 / 7p75a) TaxID=644966 RepID=E6SL47_THEM7|nr:EamA family transporter [Thermaerobacter marianensis]ADU50249.1 protein of unknown function DUF6 transmembrane [Thermaerobacter marianensis DSM 12885]
MDGRTLALAGLTLVFWSSAFTVIRAGLAYWSPGQLALVRFLVASVALAVGIGLQHAARRRGQRAGACRGRGLRPDRVRWAAPGKPAAAANGRPGPHGPHDARRRLPLRDAGRFLVLGATGIFLYHTGLNWGETRVPAGTASLLVATAPALTALLSRLWLGERLAPRAWLGLALSFTGVAIISWAASTGPVSPAGMAGAVKPLSASGPAGLAAQTVPGDGAGGGPMGSLQAGISAAAGFGSPGAPAGWAGPAAVGGAALATSAFFVLQRPLASRYGSLELTAFYTWAGTLLLALAFGPGLVADLQAGRIPPAAWIPALYLGLFPSALAYWAWSAALARDSAARVASLLNLNPLLAVATAWIALGERPSWVELAGGAVALAGVLLVQGRPPTPQGQRPGSFRRQDPPPVPVAAEPAPPTPPAAVPVEPGGSPAGPGDRPSPRPGGR